MSEDLGFKAGLEIHQQLDGKKLFCNCSAMNSSKETDRCTHRKLRAVVGETGVIDVAAAHEMTKGKSFEYSSDHQDTCLVEFDEEPPHDVNKEHLATAIMVSKLLNAKIVDEVQIMRKIVVDGSNVSGFQRSMLVGINGEIETSKGIVKIPTILLEEEAAQKLTTTDKTVSFKLDRLGIALLEVSTDASLKDAEHVKEVAEYLGMILRSTERVKRGLGTIRQDVNVSIAKGYRVEIKGFQDLKSIPKVIKKEIERQQGEKEKGSPHVRKAEADFSSTFMRPMPGGARLYPETDVLPIRMTEKFKKSIGAPMLLTERTAELEKKYGLSDVHARELLKQGIDFTAFAKTHSKIKSDQIAKILIDTPKDLKSRLKIDISKLSTEDFNEVLSKLSSEEISKDAVTDILALKAQGKKVDYTSFKQADSSEIEATIKKIVESKPGLNAGAYMGLVMKELGGKVDGKTAMAVLNKLL